MVEAPSGYLFLHALDIHKSKELTGGLPFPGVLLIDQNTGERDFSQFGSYAEEYKQRWLIYDAMPKKCNCVSCQMNTPNQNPILETAREHVAQIYNKVAWALSGIEVSQDDK